MKCPPSATFAVLAAALTALSSPTLRAEEPADGKFPPPQPPEGKWIDLMSGALADHWTAMSVPLDAPFISTVPDDGQDGQFVIKIDRGPTGLIRSRRAFENYILEFEWRHLTEAPNAGGGNGTSGNSGLIIHHSAFPKPGGPYPDEGHEVQVCHLGNGSWYTSHGDTFTMPGSTSQAIPDPRFGVSHACGHRSMPVAFHGSPTGEWNRIRITTVDGVIQHEVNGHLASSLYRATPRKGYLSLESEGAPVEFRRMRLQELAPDPELAPRDVAPLLPEDMLTTYVKKREPMPLPAGNFIAMADASAPLPLSALVTGLDFPDQAVKGRVVVESRGGSVRVTENGREILANRPLPASAAPVWHLEAGKFGHVLLFTPAPPATTAGQ